MTAGAYLGIFSAHFQFSMFKKISAFVFAFFLSAIGATASTTTLNGFALTSGTYSETANWESAVDTEFGTSATIASFEQLKATFTTTAQIASLANLIIGNSVGVTYGGNQIYSGNRAYFIVYHGSSVQSGFLVHDKIGDVSTNNQISLGSWYFDRKILAANVAPASAPVPETSTTLLGLLGSLFFFRRKRH